MYIFGGLGIFISKLGGGVETTPGNIAAKLLTCNHPEIEVKNHCRIEKEKKLMMRLLFSGKLQLVKYKGPARS